MQINDTTLIRAFDAYIADAPESDNGRKIFSRRIAIKLADLAHMDVKPLVYKLERMGLIPLGAWDWFEANGGFTRDHFEEAYNDIALNQKERD